MDNEKCPKCKSVNTIVCGGDEGYEDYECLDCKNTFFVVWTDEYRNSLHDKWSAQMRQASKSPNELRLEAEIARLTAETRALQAKIDEALTIELYKQGTVDDEDERLWNAGFNAARGEFRKVLEGK